MLASASPLSFNFPPRQPQVEVRAAIGRYGPPKTSSNSLILLLGSSGRFVTSNLVTCWTKYNQRDFQPPRTYFRVRQASIAGEIDPCAAETLGPCVGLNILLISHAPNSPGADLCQTAPAVNIFVLQLG